MEKQTDKDTMMLLMYKEIQKLAKRSELISDNETGKILESISTKLDAFTEQKSFTQDQRKAIEAAVYATSELVKRDITTTSTELTSQIEVLCEKLDNLALQDNKVIKRHEFMVDFKNSKAAITLIIMGLVTLISAGMNIWQCNRIDQQRDNDIKYRYVKMHSGASTDELLKLENAFVFHRNKDSVTLIRKQVESYERLVNEQVQKSEQARLNAARALQLQQEAESVKGK